MSELIIDDEQKEFGRAMAAILCKMDSDELNTVGNWILCALADFETLTAKPADDGMYFIQDTRSYIGNCPLWWGKNSSGYTTNIAQAGRYTREQAIAQMNCRGSDLPWRCVEIEPLIRNTIDAQYLPRGDKQQRAFLMENL